MVGGLRIRGSPTARRGLAVRTLFEPKTRLVDRLLARKDHARAAGGLGGSPEPRVEPVSEQGVRERELRGATDRARVTAEAEERGRVVEATVIAADRLYPRR